jgi:hypothetical protein
MSPSQARYQQRRAQGLCGHCGAWNDQDPYVRCSQCYTPHPRISRLFPKDIRESYNMAYAWYLRQQTMAPVEIGCCGQFWTVTGVPFRAPCCGRVFGTTEKEA